MALVPLPSERCTTWMATSGRVTPELSAAISASFHLVTWPRKMSAIVLPLNWRRGSAGDPLGAFRLYEIATAPSAAGMWRIAPFLLEAISASVIGCADAPQCLSCARNSDLPQP